MIKALLAMTAAYAVLGGAVALGFLGIAVWIGVLLLAAAVLAGLSFFTGTFVHLRRVAFLAPLARHPAPAALPRRFSDDGDYPDA
jgi:hypothetical protein